MSTRGFKWRKWNNILHRDIGYLVVGLTIIYSLSGIALNHRKDWNPNFQVDRRDVQWTRGAVGPDVTRAEVEAFLTEIGEEGMYKNHYYPSPEFMKVFLQHGSVMLDVRTGEGYVERLRKRPFFYEFNYLHYNPTRLWTWFSDIFCGALMLVAVTGLFVLKGRKGITGRGAWLTGIGVVLPALFLLMYL